jgi:hypothetical protein
MNVIGRLFRPQRVFAAWLLLVSLFAGEVADAHHHLSEHGCSADRGGLHVSAVASEAPTQLAPVAREREYAPLALAHPHRLRAASGTAPRAPPTA